MPFTYPIRCTALGCTNLARYKVASRWSDGITEELKPYGLPCADCLPAVYRQSLEKQKACRLARGETLETPAIFDLRPGTADAALPRLTELEQQVLQDG